jgi:hypothetical protein
LTAIKKVLSLYYNYSNNELSNNMTITNATGSKKVNITERNDLGYTSVFAQYIQLINTGVGVDEQVLESKSFSTLKGAQKWANNTLGL